MISGGGPGSRRVRILRFRGDSAVPREDRVAVEEPLEIRIRAGDQLRAVAVTMRTPGRDLALAAGFLLSEGLVAGRGAIQEVVHCGGEGEARGNVVEVRLSPGLPLPERLGGRTFPVTSACGVCGRTSLDELALRCAPLPDGPVIHPSVLRTLPALLRDAQRVFQRTGGLHAAALVRPDGVLESLEEDVGRHNAVDRVVGGALLDDRLPLSDRILLVSGRTSWEILQKGLGAGIPVVAGVGAPSSLAVRLARAFNVTLVGFLREDGFNLYAGEARVPAGTPASV